MRLCLSASLQEIDVYSDFKHRFGLGLEGMRDMMTWALCVCHLPTGLINRNLVWQ